ncbi:MAG: M56 family metallopeptidase, partial [Planctomycetaceae bacterium]|nr:M56 family metallopeptidase [Planctomycetaceae bacterium]
MNAAQLLEVFASVAVQVTLVICATGLIARCIGVARTRCQLWTVCYTLVLAVLLNALLLPHLRLLRRTAPVELSRMAAILDAELLLGKVLLIVWLSGIAISLARFLYRSIMTERFLKQCQPISPEVFSLSQVFSADELRELAEVRGKTVQLLSSTAVQSPFCWQFHRPLVVLPEYLLSFEPEQLRFILRHELEHLRTGHPLQVFLQHTVEVLFWFHPLVW